MGVAAVVLFLGPFVALAFLAAALNRRRDARLLGLTMPEYRQHRREERRQDKRSRDAHRRRVLRCTRCRGREIPGCMHLPAPKPSARPPHPVWQRSVDRDAERLVSSP